MHLSLCFNPSHLEFVDPGGHWPYPAPSRTASATASREKGMALLIHGDASFAGQGVIQETLNMSQLAGYTVGGPSM